MYYIFKNDGSYEHSDEWPQSNKLAIGEHVYVLQEEGNNHLWYLNRRVIGPMSVNLSDVPERYIKFAKMLKLVLPKG